MNLRFSRKAAADLEDIGDFIAQDDPLRAASREPRAASFVAELQGNCQKLLDNPDAYPTRPELGRGMRASAHGKYLIFFKSVGNDLLIVRILHGARNLTGILNL